MANNMTTSKKPPMLPGPGGPGGPGGIGRGGAVQKPKNFKSSLKRLLKYLRPQIPTLIAVILLAVVGTVFTIITPKILAKATNAMQTGIIKGGLDIPYILMIIGTVVGLYVLAAIFNLISQFLSAGMAQRIVFKLRQDIKDKLAKLPINYYDTNTAGDILSRITNDIDTIATSLQQSITQAITSVLTIVGIFIMMLTISGWMTLIAVATLPLFLIITMLIAGKSQKKFVAQQRELGQLNGYIEEIYSSRKIVKLFNQEKQSSEHFSKINDKLCKTGTGAQFLSGMIMPLLNFVNNIGYTAVCVVGGILAGGTPPLMIGDIQAFIQYSNQFGQPIMQTANIANTIQSTIAAAERVFELLDQSEEPLDPPMDIDISKVDANVEFKNVSFSYDSSKPLITNLNLTVPSGGRVAIVGPTGAGKTTLVNLLLRFYEITAGEIYVGGINIKDYKKEDLRALFGMVLQETWLTNDTIRENVAYGKTNATDEEVEEACRRSHIDHYISTLPDGYNTVLNEEGTNISSGQKQLITIARAILADNKILILDEATSSVDTRTESYITNAMTEMMIGKTSFIIAHRLSTIRNASMILVMEQGNIVEQGTHDQLIEKKGAYFKLYNSQFSK